MPVKVLVAYASKYGATAQIAERVALWLTKCGLNAEARNLKDVIILSGYTAAIVGSGVYAGMWLKEAANFLKKNETALTKMPVWFFSDGPTGAGDPEELMNGWRFPEDLKPVADRIHPRGMVFFHGVIDTAKLKFAEKLILGAMKAPVGDFRDWDKIQDWTNGVAKELTMSA